MFKIIALVSKKWWYGDQLIKNVYKRNISERQIGKISRNRVTKYDNQWKSIWIREN